MRKEKDSCVRRETRRGNLDIWAAVGYNTVIVKQK